MTSPPIRFLKGCKTFFLLCMLCAAVSALADMIAPQIEDEATNDLLS